MGSRPERSRPRAYDQRGMAGSMLALQSTHGNRFVQRLLDPAGQMSGNTHPDPARAGGGKAWPAAGEALEETQGAMAGEPSISVTQKAKSLTNSGSAEYKVQWSVQSGFFGWLSKLFSGQKSGWIIQHVKFKADVVDDKGAAKVPNNPDGLEYWEGWQVDAGKVWVGFATSGAQHSADTFRTVDEGAKTKGTVSVTGRVNFLEGFALAMPPWGHTVAAAGSLPTVTASPAGWKDADAQDHKMTVTWDATGAAATQTVLTTP